MQISRDSFSAWIICEIPIYLIFEALIIYWVTKIHEI